MPPRITIRNANSFVQIDSNFKNMELLYKSSIVLTSQDAMGVYADIGLPAGRSGLLVAVRDTTNSGGCHTRMQAVNVMRIYADQGALNRTVTVYLFASISDDTLPKVPKVVIRDPATGRVIFSSTKRYLKVLGVFAGNLEKDQETSATFPGKTIAIIQCMRPEYERLTTGGTPTQPSFTILLHKGLMRVNGDTAYVKNGLSRMFTSLGGGVNNEFTISPARYIYIDVTGY